MAQVITTVGTNSIEAAPLACHHADNRPPRPRVAHRSVTAARFVASFLQFVLTSLGYALHPQDVAEETTGGSQAGMNGGGGVMPFWMGRWRTMPMYLKAAGSHRPCLTRFGEHLGLNSLGGSSWSPADYS